jgi:hypothetical protein
MWAMSKAAMLAVKLFLPKLYPYIAMVLGTVVVLGIVYSMGKGSAEKKAHIERIEAENQLLRNTIQKHRTTIEQDNKIAASNEERMVELEAKAKEVIDSVQNPTDACLGADDVDRLRGLWGEGKAER